MKKIKSLLLSAILLSATAGQWANAQHKEESLPESVSSSKMTAPTDFIKKFDENMVVIEGGTYKMGGEELRDTKPVHDVTVKTFSMSKYEITVKEYRAYCNATGRPMPEAPPWKTDGKWDEDHPMVNITWFEARDFAQWVGGRLPTEAEWEYAAKGGKLTRGYKYAGSNNFDEIAWHKKNSGEKTHPVGQKKPNELGLYDMSGNVWEWCQDWYDRKYYEVSPKDDPKGPETGLGKTRRGGSWYFNPERSLIIVRDHYSPTVKLFGMGIRVVKDIK